jgi:CheY-like chemotaxis protein
MKKRVLYVEDIPQNMLLVKRIMDAMGYELLEAVDGEAGWHAIIRQHPDLILMDLRLPGDISGFELIRKIRRHPELNRIPIVVLTAYGYEEVEEQAIAAGCDGFLTKPADIRQIRTTIDQFLYETPIGEPATSTHELVAQPLATVSYTFI